MRRLLFFVFAVGAILCPATMAQNCASSTNSTKLACLVTNQLGVSTSTFQSLNEAVGISVSDLPLASPSAGVIYTLDPKLNLPVPSDQTLGPILTQRPETAGRHKLYFAGVYQFFRFEEL